MSIPSILDVIAYVESQDEITSAEVLVLTAIANRANPQGYTYASLKTLQKYANITERTIRDALRRLESRGAIKTSRDSGHRTSTYELLIPHNHGSKTTLAEFAGTPAEFAANPVILPEKG